MLKRIMLVLFCLSLSRSAYGQIIEKIDDTSVSITTTSIQVSVSTLDALYEERSLLEQQLKNDTARMQKRIDELSAIIEDAEEKGVKSMVTSDTTE